MQKIHFLYNFIIVLAALITCAIVGEFYLSTLLIMLPVYYLAYAVYLAVNYRKMANRAAFPFKGLRLCSPVLLFILPLLPRACLSISASIKPFAAEMPAD